MASRVTIESSLTLYVSFVCRCSSGMRLVIIQLIFHMHIDVHSAHQDGQRCLCHFRFADITTFHIYIQILRFLPPSNRHIIKNICKRYSHLCFLCLVLSLSSSSYFTFIYVFVAVAAREKAQRDHQVLKEKSADQQCLLPYQP